MIALKWNNLFSDNDFTYTFKIYLKIFEKLHWKIQKSLHHLDFLFQKRFVSKLELTWNSVTKSEAFCVARKGETVDIPQAHPQDFWAVNSSFYEFQGLCGPASNYALITEV